MIHLHHFRAIDNRYCKTHIILALSLLCVLGLCFAPSRAQAGPPPIQTYFVPLPEMQVQTALEAVDTGQPDIGDVMRSMISIAATGDNTIIYYDHWEDGYEADLANPVQASTEVWGDNDPVNGIPPGFGTDIINAGDVITLASDVALPRNPAQIRYDGRDKFGGTCAVAVTRASWALDPGVVLAGAVEVYPLRDYGLQFEVPVGEDLGSDSVIAQVVFKTERGYGPGYYIGSIVAQIVFGLLANIIVAWFSRRREFRADAGGANLSSNRQMADALRALQRVHEPEPLPNEMAAFGINGGLKSLFSTHPPLEQRIAALEGRH